MPTGSPSSRRDASSSSELVPKSVWDRFGGSEEFDAELVDEGKDVKRKELEEEKARLLARIAEIDKLLAE